MSAATPKPGLYIIGGLYGMEMTPVSPISIGGLTGIAIDIPLIIAIALFLIYMIYKGSRHGN